MPASTRSKRKQEPHADAPVSKKRSGLSNISNFKSPRKLTHLNVNDKVPERYLPVVKVKRLAPASTTEVPSTQSGEFVLSQAPQEPPADGVKMMRNVKKVLEHNFKNVSDRLQLQSVPPCLYNLSRCHQSHVKKVEVNFAGSESVYLAKNFLEEERHTQFIMYVQNSMCGRKEFPGVSVVRGVLELILKISADDSKTCSTSAQSLTELHNLFISILATFPVCHIRSSYLQVLCSPFKISSIRVGSPERGILQAMLELLTDLIQNDVTKEKPRNSLSQEMFNNFYLWDAACDEKFSFENFTRDDKFRRIFIVLDLLTRVLENDLAMFIIKNSRRLRSSIGSENHRPLICAFLWQDYESVLVVNETIKTIINIFVNMTALNHPAENIRVVSRLLNLVAQVTNLYEYPDETFEYPSYNNLSLDLMRAVQKTIEASRYYCVEFYTSVCEKIRSPLLQLLLTNEIITKIHGGSSRPISLELPFECIRKKEFMKFKEATVEETTANDVKFPPLNPKHKQKKCEVSQKSYLNLLRIYAAALNSFYQIQACFNAINKIDDHPNVPAPLAPTDFTSFPEKLPDVDLSEKAELRNVDVNFKKLVHIKLSIETCSFYRNEIKYFIILPKLLKKCHDKYREKFSDWMKLMEEMEKV